MNHTHDLEAIAILADRSPLDVLETFLERAAIRQYLAGYDRADAERLALQDTRDVFLGCAVSADLAPDGPDDVLSSSGSQGPGEPITSARGKTPQVGGR